MLFECHQVSKIRKFVIRNVHNKKNSYIIFTNDILKKEFNINKNFEKNLLVLHNGYDNDYFEEETKFKKEKKSCFLSGSYLDLKKTEILNF